MAIIVGQRLRNITNATTVGTTTTGFTVHTFSTAGVTTFTVQGSGLVEVLVVGGGGGGGTNGPGSWAGGGGGGSVLYQKNVQLIDGVSYTATVASGGIGNTDNINPLGFGGTSILTYNAESITSPGGAFGGSGPGIAGGNNPLGSGGGGGRGTTPSSGGFGANIIGYGFSGSSNPGTGGGGGGAGGQGQPGVGAPAGIGVSYSITGVSAYYGGGGGGGGLPHPTSSPTNFGLGGGQGGPPTTGRPGCIIIRYQY